MLVKNLAALGIKPLALCSNNRATTTHNFQNHTISLAMILLATDSAYRADFAPS